MMHRLPMAWTLCLLNSIVRPAKAKAATGPKRGAMATAGPKLLRATLIAGRMVRHAAKVGGPTVFLAKAIAGRTAAPARALVRDLKDAGPMVRHLGD